jgi:stage V sporulation protein S
MENIDLKVSAKSNPVKVAGSIVKNIAEGKKVAIVAVGAGAVNQAVKAIAIARGYSSPLGNDLVVIPAFMDLEIEKRKITAMKFILRNL